MQPSKPSESSRRGRVYLFALLAAVAAVVTLLSPGRERLHAAGPANAGHERLTCAQCHVAAEGTVRQQVQANVRHLVGLRATGADFMHRAVGNVDCVACHDNQDDAHPAYRFNEPRFAEVRASLAPQNCVSCHAEHSGQRVTAPATVCQECHSDMEIAEDPAQPSHAFLVSNERWGSCLSCHDFHGNHVREVPTLLSAGPSEEAVQRYLAGGPAIYGDSVRFPARTEREDP